MSKQLLAEMFGIVGLPAINKVTVTEGPYDDINRQLAGAKSVAGGGGGQRPRVGQGGDVQRAQTQLDTSRSVFKKPTDEAATGAQGITLNGDRETLDALMQCLQEAEHSVDDKAVSQWAGRAWKAVAAGIRGDGSVTLPKFETAPEPVDDVDQDLMPDDDMAPMDDEEGDL